IRGVESSQDWCREWSVKTNTHGPTASGGREFTGLVQGVEPMREPTPCLKQKSPNSSSGPFRSSPAWKGSLPDDALTNKLSRSGPGGAVAQVQLSHPVTRLSGAQRSRRRGPALVLPNGRNGDLLP